MEKRCNRCNELKDINEFYKNRCTKDGYRSVCKECEKLTDAVRYFNRCFLTYEEYCRVKEHQHNKCAICNKEAKRFDIDHDHKSGKVRGLLCRNCNTAIGMFHENTEFMKKSIDYLNNGGIDF